mmetsp:Transcript_54624/g.128258  ORF Transcript_54624/g.128258 Transcript_54624/m.128258 type:complete len:371 (+) Transcript_54624:3529-4641(+)
MHQPQCDLRHGQARQALHARRAWHVGADPVATAPKSSLAPGVEPAQLIHSSGVGLTSGDIRDVYALQARNQPGLEFRTVGVLAADLGLAQPKPPVPAVSPREDTAGGGQCHGMLGSCSNLVHGNHSPLRLCVLFWKPHFGGSETVGPGSDPQGAVASQTPSKEAAGLHQGGTPYRDNGKCVVRTTGYPLHDHAKSLMNGKFHLLWSVILGLCGSLTQLSVGVVAAGHKAGLGESGPLSRLQVFQHDGVVIPTSDFDKVTRRVWLLLLRTFSLLEHSHRARPVDAKDLVSLGCRKPVAQRFPHSKGIVAIVAPTHQLGSLLLRGAYQHDRVRIAARDLPRLSLCFAAAAEHQHPAKEMRPNTTRPAMFTAM